MRGSMVRKGFEGIIEDIKNRDDDDVIGLNKTKEETTDEQDEPEQKTESTVFGGYAKQSEEMIGTGIVAVLGINIMKGIGGLFKK